MSEKSCGTCRFWEPLFHRALPASFRGTGCCVDAKLDLPESWSSNTPMKASDGVTCFAWEPVEPESKPEPYVDRIDNDRGYVKGNVEVISWRANWLKANATPEEMRRMADYYEQKSRDAHHPF